MPQILIIEDSAYQRHRVGRALKSEGYDLLTAVNGFEGLEMVATNTPDCIVLDLIMPEMSGIKVLQTLQDQGADMPKVVLTADIQEDTRRQCLHLGASAFITKPLREDELVNTVRQALDEADRGGV
ncbi:MAG: response regulator [Chloroflexota bacterium]|nr:response regulator [Chloroflexota bacterium]